MTRDKAFAIANETNFWVSVSWVGAIIISFALNTLLAFMGGWAVLPVVVAIWVYFHYADKWIHNHVVDKYVPVSV